MNLARSTFTAPILAICALTGIVVLFSLWFIGALPVGSLPIIGNVNVDLPSFPFYAQISTLLQPLATRANEAQSLPTDVKIMLCVVIPIAALFLAMVPHYLVDFGRAMFATDTHDATE